MRKYNSNSLIEMQITREYEKGNLKLNDWFYISEYYVLSEDFIRYYKDYVIWAVISKYQMLSEEFLYEFKDKIDWANVKTRKYLSQKFIYNLRKENIIGWNIIWCYYYNNVSENFIRKHKDRIDRLGWRNISYKKNLSIKFIREFKDKLNWCILSKHIKLTPPVMEEFKDYIKEGK